MKFEYKSRIFSARFRSESDTTDFDTILNNHATQGWEFVSATSLATSMWDHGKTSGVLLTFRRELDPYVG